MRGSSPAFNSIKFILCGLIVFARPAFGQDPNRASTHVIIPNPTPRQPDLEKIYSNDSNEQKKHEALSVQAQLRAREIWLESNQILLLAQQLQQEVVSRKESVSMAANAAKVGQIEKLARSMQEKIKVQ
jgi:hypothetical protein